MRGETSARISGRDSRKVTQDVENFQGLLALAGSHQGPGVAQAMFQFVGRVIPKAAVDIRGSLPVRLGLPVASLDEETILQGKPLGETVGLVGFFLGQSVVPQSAPGRGQPRMG